MEPTQIARILGGTPRAHAAAARIAERMPDYEIARATSAQLQQAGHLTTRQAETLAACIELAHTIGTRPFHAGERFSNSRDVFERYRARFYAESREHFATLLLDSKNRVIQECIISIGSLSTSVVHPREVFSPAVRASAAAILCLHNHPSGDPAPSREDRECTQRLYRAGKILGIRVLDHVVIGHENYFSFADAGQLTGNDDDCPVMETSPRYILNTREPQIDAERLPVLQCVECGRYHESVDQFYRLCHRCFHFSFLHRRTEEKE